jgi:hypothetical protein
MRRLARICGFVVMLLLAAAPAAWASYSTCGDQIVGPDTVRCEDGSIPSFRYGDAPEALAAPKAAQPRQSGFLGVWHTSLQGVGYAHGSDIPGYTSMDGRVSLRAGDLTIGANGAYVWNTLSPGFGRWLRLLDVEDWDFLMVDSGGTRWRGHLEADGRLKLQRDEQHIIYGTR